MSEIFTNFSSRNFIILRVEKKEIFKFKMNRKHLESCKIYAKELRN